MLRLKCKQKAMEKVFSFQFSNIVNVFKRFVFVFHVRSCKHIRHPYEEQYFAHGRRVTRRSTRMGFIASLCINYATIKYSIYPNKSQTMTGFFQNNSHVVILVDKKLLVYETFCCVWYIWIWAKIIVVACCDNNNNRRQRRRRRRSMRATMRTESAVKNAQVCQRREWRQWCANGSCFAGKGFMCCCAVKELHCWTFDCAGAKERTKTGVWVCSAFRSSVSD